MAGTNRPNGSSGQYKIGNASGAKYSGPNTQQASMKPSVQKGGDLRAKGSK